MACTVAAMEAAALDADAAQLAEAGADAADLEVFELCTRAEACRLRAVVLFFVCQGLLAGLSCVAGFLAFGAPGERLPQALRLLEPRLTGTSIAFAEASLVGSLLQVWHTLERAAASLADPAAGREACDEREVRRHAWAQATCGLIAAVANGVVLVCCLISASDGDSYGVAAWAEAGRPGWHAGGARLLLGLRAGFGLAAMVPAVLDVQYLVARSLPVEALAPLLGLCERERSSPAAEA